MTLPSAGSACFDELASRIELSEAGTTLLCLCDEPEQRTALVERARREIEAPRGIEVDAARFRGELLAAHLSARCVVQATAAGREGEPLCMHVVNLERLSGTQWHRVVHRLQSHRDEFRRPILPFPPPLSVLWLTGALFGDIARAAPDFFSYTEEKFLFTPPPGPSEEPADASFADPRSHSTSPRDGEEVITGWIHSVTGRVVEVYLQGAGEDRIVSTSIAYFLSLPVVLAPGTPIAFASWEERGTSFFQFRQSDPNFTAPQGAAELPDRPEDWDDPVAVEAYLNQLGRHFGEDDEQG